MLQLNLSFSILFFYICFLVDIDRKFPGNCWGDIVLTLHFQVTSPLNARGKRFMPTVAVEKRMMVSAFLFCGFNTLNIPCFFMLCVSPSCEAHYHFLGPKRSHAQRRVSTWLHVKMRVYHQHGWKFDYYTEQICKLMHTHSTFSKQRSVWQGKRKNNSSSIHEIPLNQFVHADLASSLVLVLSLQTREDESFHLLCGEVSFVSHFTHNRRQMQHF